MAGLYSRIKTWVSGEVLTAADQNAEHDNHITNAVPAQHDDYSATVAEMKLNTDPGEVGSESLATSLAGELERQRFAIKEIKGTDEWYESAATSLTSLAGTATSSRNKILSGAVKSTSGQPLFLTPDGAATEVTLAATATTFQVVINGAIVNFTTDVTLTGLTTAPTSQNTALVDDADLTAQLRSLVTGEGNDVLTIGTVGTEISNLVGEWASFLMNGEYFFAYVKSATELTHCFRGWFFDDLDAPVVRVATSDTDTITLMSTSWIFARSDGTTLVEATNNPSIGADTPSGAVINDYWLDTINNTWKRHNGSAFIADNSTLIGICLQDGTNTVAARSFDFGNAFSEKNDINLTASAVDTVRSTEKDSIVNVYGNSCEFKNQILNWVMPTDLDTGAEASATTYYIYVAEDCDLLLSTVVPHYRKELYGYYHTHETWRCIGTVLNDGSSDFEEPFSYFENKREFALADASGVLTASYADVATVTINKNEAGPVLLGLNGKDATVSAVTCSDVSADGSATVNLRVIRNGTTISTVRAFGIGAGSASSVFTLFPALVHVDLNAPAGELEYVLQGIEVDTGIITNADFYALAL